MKERPILFSSDMVRALLDGRKTQTRRLCKPMNAWIKQDCREVRMADGRPFHFLTGATSPLEELRSPYGRPGDKLYVRETWHAHWGPPTPGARIVTGVSVRQSDGSIAQASATEPLSVHYAADADGDAPFGRKWKPSIHMPRWASRITLEVTGVRVELLQDISEADAQHEGVERLSDDLPYWFNYQSSTFEYTCLTARDSFRTLWDSLNPAHGYGWDANPWVWVMEFKRIEV